MGGGPRIPSSVKERVVDLYKQGIDWHLIAPMCNISKDSVRHLIKPFRTDIRHYDKQHKKLKQKPVQDTQKARDVHNIIKQACIEEGLISQQDAIQLTGLSWLVISNILNDFPDIYETDNSLLGYCKENEK